MGVHHFPIRSKFPKLFEKSCSEIAKFAGKWKCLCWRIFFGKANRILEQLFQITTTAFLKSSGIKHEIWLSFYQNKFPCLKSHQTYYFYELDVAILLQWRNTFILGESNIKLWLIYPFNSYLIFSWKDSPRLLEFRLSFFERSGRRQPSTEQHEYPINIITDRECYFIYNSIINNGRYEPIIPRFAVKVSLEL